MSATMARTLAREVVTAVRVRDAYAHEVLSAALEESKLSERDRGFATMLAYGTISCRGTLDEAVVRYLSPGRELEPMVGDALAVSAYELLFSGKAAHAAVSEGVELVKAIRPAAAGLANAVLRKLAADAPTFPWGDPLTDIEALARLHGHPTWLAQLLVDEFGHEAAAAFMEADNEPAPLYLAHASLERSFEEVLDSLNRDGADPVETAIDGCIEARVPSRAIASKALKRKDVLVCDAAAQFAVSCVPSGPGAWIVEIGAGRGTKSVLLAAMARRRGGPAFRVTAVDPHAFKLKELRDTASVLGLPEISTCVADATTDAPGLPADGSADAVLIDAPCTGLGTLRRHPDRRWKAKPEEIETLALLGSALLQRAARLVKPGGFMVYSTCTVTRAENRGVLEEFLASEAGEGFAYDTVTANVPAGWERWLGEDGMFQSLPTQGGPDGHFVARLIRKG